MTKVMLVDDDRNLQRIFLSIFKMNNFEIVSQAYDGVQAVEQYDSLNSKPDVVIMDQRMPKMDGITATRKIIKIDPDARIIFLSADDTAETKALNAGAKLFLTKPISIETVLESIDLVQK